MLMNGLMPQGTLDLFQKPNVSFLQEGEMSTEEDDGPDSKLSLNVFMDKEKSKVIFAEADSQFVDLLLSFLTLPLGKIVKIWEKHYSSEAPIFGSLHTLQKSLSGFKHFCFRGAFDMLDDPISSLVKECCSLKLDISDSKPNQHYFCQNPSCSYRNVSMKYGNIRWHDPVACDCGMELNRRGKVSGSHIVDNDDDDDGSDVDDDKAGVFTKEDSSFIIFDDLRVVPNVKTFLQTLSNFGIKDYDEVQMVTLDFDISDIRDLFKLALFSATPLTDFAIKNLISAAVKPDFFNLADKNPFPKHPTKMILNVSLQKSTDKFLFAQAKADFVEFLFSLLTLPIARIEYLFGGNTSFKSIDNLYTSVRNEINFKYFVTPRIKDKLGDPKLPFGYNFRNKFLIPREPTPTAINLVKAKHCTTFHHNQRLKLFSLKPRRGGPFFVEENTMSIVSDDLSVTPYSVASTISLLKGIGVPFSDVREIELQIGFEEALSLLKAALTSKSVLSDALINPMLKNINN